MESLSDTPWDVVISGTGLQQSLLALSLSRADKKILHIDRNDYYGGADAAFSLQEVEEWAQQVNGDKAEPPVFANAVVSRLDDGEGPKLAHSRSYTLSVSPQIIYARSKLLSQLVSSKVYRQLEFQAVGSWWLYDSTEVISDIEGDDTRKVGQLKRVPSGREDVFTDNSIDLRAKRSLMKFLKFVVDYENQLEVWEARADEALPSFLSAQFKLPDYLQAVMLALTLTPERPEKTTVRYSLPRIARHLTSIGIFGPGFGAVVPKWGGAAEIAQVACRAGAVGGGIYVLGTGAKDVQIADSKVKVTLDNDETIQSSFFVKSCAPSESARIASRSLTIVSASLTPLFSATVEGAPTSAVAIVVFSSNTISIDGSSNPYPVYVMAHSSDSGECPAGQCVLYSSTLKGDNSAELLDSAVARLLESVSGDHSAKSLLTLKYEQRDREAEESDDPLSLPYTGLDLAFDDAVLDDVERAWRKLASPASDADVPFMTFDDREGAQVDDDE